MCSFASTEHYLVLLVWPCTYDFLRMLIHQSVMGEMVWMPELGVKIHVIDKHQGGKGHVATYRSDACMPLSDWVKLCYGGMTSSY